MTRERIPLCDLCAQYTEMGAEISAAIADVVAAQEFVLGDRVAHFERLVSEMTGTAHAVGVASGSDALYLALRAQGIGSGDAVFVPDFTFFATAEAVARTGAVPLFVDVDPQTMVVTGATLGARAAMLDMRDGLVDPKSGTIVRAVVPVHLFGQCAPMREIEMFAKRHDLVIIEDAAQALGAKDDGRLAGSFGTAAALSFFPSKNLGGYGDGGAVVTHDGEVAARVMRLRSHGAGRDGSHEEIGVNSRLDALQAAILTAKAPHLSDWNARRRAAAARYDALFHEAGVTQCILPRARDGSIHVFHQYVLRVSERAPLMVHLHEHGIACRAYYPIPLHAEPCFLHESDLDAEGAEELARTALAIPMFPEIAEAQQREVVTAIAQFFKGR